eukprot:jgi/Psemu1/24267/gm1.24267_g
MTEDKPTTTTTTTTDNFDMMTCAKEYTQKIYNNVNQFNTFGEKGEEYALAETVTRKEATDPAKHSPGDAILHEMFTKEIRMKNYLEEAFLFYYNISSPRNMHKRAILDQALKIY